jgi:hypothetical protein
MVQVVKLNNTQEEKVEKVRLTVKISKEVDSKFREFIVRKHKAFSKGLLSLEVERALREYLERHKHEVQ